MPPKALTQVNSMSAPGVTEVDPPVLAASPCSEGAGGVLWRGPGCFPCRNLPVQFLNPSSREVGARRASITNSARHFLNDVFGNCYKEDQQTSSTRKPLSTEGGARMASTSKSPRHFLQDVFGNLHKRGTTRTLNKGALKHRTWGKDGFNNQISKALFAGCLLEIGTKRPHKRVQRGIP